MRTNAVVCWFSLLSAAVLGEVFGWLAFSLLSNNFLMEVLGTALEERKAPGLVDEGSFSSALSSQSAPT